MLTFRRIHPSTADTFNMSRFVEVDVDRLNYDKIGYYFIQYFI